MNKNFLFQYRVVDHSDKPKHYKRHVVSAEDVWYFLASNGYSSEEVLKHMSELRSGKTAVIAIPFKSGYHINLIYRDPSEITCERCRYNVYGLRTQFQRQKTGETHGHGFPRRRVNE